jgi:L,D-transpeptidase ErfK/SrfK
VKTNIHRLSAALLFGFAVAAGAESEAPPADSRSGSLAASPESGERTLPPVALAEPDPSALRYTEEDFFRKSLLDIVYDYELDQDFRREKSVIGSRRFYTAQSGDTFLDIARFYGLGYNEIDAANEGVDPWLPERADAILLPTEWVLPRTEGKGVVVNIPEMRLYYFRDGRVYTYPVGLGRDDWRTPKGQFKIQGKTENPQWVIPDSIREERIREKGLYDRAIPGGDPRNPLGKYRLELSMPGYRIHGTNKTYGVGMQVSHGCVRLYPEDIERLFGMVNVGSPGEFLYQPVKVGSRGGRIYVEVHADIYTLMPGLYGEARRLLSERAWLPYVDADKLQRAVEEQTGLPVDITAAGFRAPLSPERDLPLPTDQPPRNL